MRHDRSIIGRVVDSGRPHVVAADPIPGNRGPEQNECQVAIPATLAAPIRVQDKTIGVIYAEHLEPRKYFASSDEEAVTFLAPKPPRRCGTSSSRPGCGPPTSIGSP